MGYGGLNLPYDIPANEFLTIEGRKLSTSQNWAVWLPDYLSRYEPDPLRYLLSINMPETGDTDFSWREFVRRNNDELVATYGNLVNRVLTFVYRNFDGCVPTHSNYDILGKYMSDTNLDINRDKLKINIDESTANILEETREDFRSIDENLAKCQFKQAITQVMHLAQQTNQYLDKKSPWKIIKGDKQAAADSLYVALYVISCLKTMLYPFLPFSSQKLHEYLGFKGKVEDYAWQPQTPLPGQKLISPQPLFAKLDEKLIEEEAGRVGQAYH